MVTRAMQVETACRHFSQVDPILAAQIRQLGPYTLKLHRDRFDMLARSILSQQISTRAARAVRLKLLAILDAKSVTPANIADATDEQFRAAGLSRQKIAYLRSLADHVLSGQLQLQRLGREPDEEVVSQLVAVKGIGTWTAQMFLIFALGRWDVFPSGDLGVRVSLGRLYGLGETPTPRQCDQLAFPWKPWSTVATWYLWRMTDMINDPHQPATGYPV